MRCNISLVLYQRESKSYRLVVTSPDNVDCDPDSATYNPEGRVSLSGHELRLTIKRNIADDDEDALIVKSSDNPGEIDFEAQTALPWDENSTLGEAVAYLVPADSDPEVNEDMTAGRAWMDIWFILSTGEQILVLPPSPIDIRDTVGP